MYDPTDAFISSEKTLALTGNAALQTGRGVQGYVATHVVQKYKSEWRVLYHRGARTFRPVGFL